MLTRAFSFSFLSAVLCASASARAQWSPPVQLVQPDGIERSAFGHTVAISGDTIVVGAYKANVGDNIEEGSASVYRRTGTDWTFEALLTAADGGVQDWFGSSVAISGDTVVVGSPREEESEGAPNRGAAYVFTRSGTTWTQQQKLTARDGLSNDYFGQAVGISGDSIVVGAYVDTVGANNDQGSAYVFTRSGTIWIEQAQLIASDGAAGDYFGSYVGMSGDTVVVGAPDATVGGNNDQGSAYVFTRSGTTWTEQQKLTASDGAAGDTFGQSVDLSDETVVVGAPLHDVGTLSNAGSAYVFTRSGTTWTQQARLDGTKAAVSFATSVGISGDAVVVGAYNGGDLGQGAAYVFIRAGTIWTQEAVLTAPDGADNDRFGYAFDISGDAVVIGADGDDVGDNDDQGSAWASTRGSTCRADFDGDGFVTGLDFDLYVQAFEAGDIRADFDGDGFLTGIDFDLYVQAFEAGC